MGFLGDNQYRGSGGAGYGHSGESNRDLPQANKNKSSASDNKDSSSASSKLSQRDSSAQQQRNGPINSASGGTKQQSANRVVNGQ